MPPLDSRIYVRARGADWFDWKSVQVEKSILNCAAGFELTAVDRGSAQLAPGNEIEIRAGDQVALKGYVENVDDRISDNEHELKISGRERNVDLIDTSASPEGPMEFRNLNLFELVTKLTGLNGKSPTDSPGFLFSFDADLGDAFVGERGPGFGKPFALFPIEHGESRWSAIERACQLRGVLAYGDGQQLVIEKAAQQPQTELVPTFSAMTAEIQNALRAMARGPSKKVPTTLKYGANVISATLQLRDSVRYSVYLVRGQQSGDDANWGVATNEPEGRAEDKGVGRNRTLVIIGEGQLSQQSAELRAKWEATVRAAQSQKLVVVTPGWTLPEIRQREQTSPTLWPLNRLVPVVIPKMRIAADMLIERLRFSKTATEGTTTELTLVRADAYVPVPVIESDGGPFEEYLRDRGIQPRRPDEEESGEE